MNFAAADRPLKGRQPAPAGVHQGILIEDCQIVDSAAAGIEISSASGVTVRGNQIIRPAGAAVLIHHAREVQLTANTREGGTTGLQFGVKVDLATIKKTSDQAGF